MSRKTFMPAILAALLCAGIAQAKIDKVKEIDVEIDLNEVTNPAAALRYGTVDADLEAALAARLVDRIAEEGMRISIDLSELELSNSFTEVMGMADTRLVGIVKIIDLNDNSNFASYELSVDVNHAKMFFPAEVDMASLTASSDAYYAAMIAAFADVVVLRLDE